MSAGGEQPELARKLVFHLFDSADPSAQAVVGSIVMHHQFKDGHIVSVTTNALEKRFSVKFVDGRTKTFPIKALLDNFSNIVLPTSYSDYSALRRAQARMKEADIVDRHAALLAAKRAEQDALLARQVVQRKEQAARELPARREFEELRNRYHVMKCHDPSPTNFLFELLKRLDESGRIDTKHHQWLVAHRYYAVVAANWANEFVREPSEFAFSKACRYYRDAGLARLGLQLYFDFSHKNPARAQRLLANEAVRTSFAAAIKDELGPEEALPMAKSLLKENPRSHFIHNLMGGILWRLRRFVEAIEHFEEAAQLCPIEAWDPEEWLRKVPVVDRASVARMLLARDPLKYGWAENYLRRRESTVR